MSKKSSFANTLQYELFQKNNKIEILSKEKIKYAKVIHSMQTELFLLKSKLLNNNKLEKELKSFHDRNLQLEKEIQRLAGDILEIHRKYNDEKRKNENIYNEEIKNLKLENEKYKTKIEMVNELAREKNGILKAFDNVLQERNAILIEHDKMIREKEINNEIKVSNLKKKMIDSVNEAKSKVDELNAECLDNTTKLIYLQNSQLLLKIEYQTQHLNKLNEKNQELENKINELKKDIQIHREVEISLAEKNKKLINENNKLKKEKEIDIDKDKDKEKEELEKTQLISCNSSINLRIKTNNTNNNRIIQLEQKVINLEKLLLNKRKEYNEILDKNDSIEKILKNYEEKYAGLFNYFEECLKMFINDEELKKNKNIYINLNSIEKGDFSKLNNEEKYSTLIILMKYLMPLIHKTEYINNINKLNDVNLKFHFMKNKNILDNINNDKVENNFLKKYMIKKNKNNNNFEPMTPKNIKYNSFDGLPNIEKKINLLKIPLLSPKKKY